MGTLRSGPRTVYPVRPSTGVNRPVPRKTGTRLIGGPFHTFQVSFESDRRPHTGQIRLSGTGLGTGSREISVIAYPNGNAPQSIFSQRLDHPFLALQERRGFGEDSNEGKVLLAFRLNAFRRRILPEAHAVPAPTSTGPN